MQHINISYFPDQVMSNSWLSLPIFSSKILDILFVNQETQWINVSLMQATNTLLSSSPSGQGYSGLTPLIETETKPY